MATPLDKPSRSVTRVTDAALGYGHGSDRDRKLMVTLAYGDMIVLKPKGRRTGVVTLMLADIYTYGLKCQVLKTRLEKARAVKAKNEAKRQARKSKRIITGGLNT